jgi:hypothetical protein
MGTGPFYLNYDLDGWNEADLAVLSKYPGYWKRLANPGDNNLDMIVDENDLWFFCGAFITYWKTGYCDFLCDFDGDGDIDENSLWYFCARFIDYYKCGLHGYYVP